MTRVPSDERRAALIRAALLVIDRDGVSAATTRAIVAEAGMSLASFHYAFRSRDEMMRELIAFLVANEKRVTLAAVAPGTDIRTAIRAGLQAYFDLLVEYPQREQALFELMNYSLRTPELDTVPAAQYASYFAAASELLEYGAVATGVTWSRPVREVARILIAINDGYTLAWLADRDTDAAGRLMDFAADTIAALSRPASPAIPAPATPATTQEPRQ
jgi:AcrR family transcriptional regulator